MEKDIIEKMMNDFKLSAEHEEEFRLILKNRPAINEDPFEVSRKKTSAFAPPEDCPPPDAIRDDEPFSLVASKDQPKRVSWRMCRSE